MHKPHEHALNLLEHELINYDNMLGWVPWCLDSDYAWCCLINVTSLWYTYCPWI